MMYRLYIVNKNNRQRVGIIATGLTEKEAENICEAWGWNYCDESGVSYWMDYEIAE